MLRSEVRGQGHVCFCFFGVHDTAATVDSTYLALNKAWQFS